MKLNRDCIAIMQILIVAGLLWCLTGCKQFVPSGFKSASLAHAKTFNIDERDLADRPLQGCESHFASAVAQFNYLRKVRVTSDSVFLQRFNSLDVELDNNAKLALLYSRVHPDEHVRETSELCEQAFKKLYAETMLSPSIYTRLKQIRQKDLPAIDQRFVEKILQDFVLAGVNQNPATRARLKELNHELTVIGQQFSKNIREDEREIWLTPSALNGLPEDFVAAHPTNDRGLVRLTTRYTDYLPFMQYAISDEARKKMYLAFRQRGYPKNNNVLMQMLAKRFEYAQLLDFATFAHYITSDKMIESPENAWDFINKIDAIAAPRAERDLLVLLEQLQRYIPHAREVTEWQRAHLEHLQKSENYALDARQVREYFSYTNVRDGIFDLVQNLFSVQIKPWNTEVWHDSVESYEMWEGDTLLGQFYLDMHPRPGKYGHAASFGIREGVTNVQTPISALICNFPGGKHKSGLLEHDQVETFLHEFGHLLHRTFSGNQPWLRLSGVSTEWDFVEAPSQMLEEWVWDRDTLRRFAKNAGGETLPDSLIEKMNHARKFGLGANTRHQNAYAALSLSYHDRDPAHLDVDKLMEQMQSKYSPYAFVEDTHMYASFRHLYSYSALYYTYTWSLVIASDMFSEFKRSGLQNNELANRYRRAVLSAGSSKPAAELIEAFLGRPFNFDAYTEILGVTEQSE